MYPLLNRLLKRDVVGTVGQLQPTLTDTIFMGVSKVTWAHGDLHVAVHVRLIRLIVKSFINPRQFIKPDLVYVALGERSIAILLHGPNRLCL